ncbi:ABC transporter ATP-binding protein [Litoribrevibacter euphylliae]|uniref:ABC transporter ATP-binding protein n=1 Tax=Litoribrevibacter euphylliae TaxID=1834034 RepID=A0ABV7H7X0_9GAMM
MTEQQNIQAQQPILQIKNLSVTFHNGQESTHAVKDISFDLYPAKTLALVGESGSGKSVSALSALKLHAKNVSYQGEILFDGNNLLNYNETQMRGVRGNHISMIFQEPMTSLNPLHTVEKQIAEVLYLHKGLKNSAARTRVIELLELVGIPDPQSRLKSYPHELSGGQKQRVMIAMALANEPDILLADEPTTALDVTIQKQILELLKELQQKLGMSILLITHDLNVVHKYADEVCVMRHGHLIEQGPTETIFTTPSQEYTHTLLNADPTGNPVSLENDVNPLLTTNNLAVRFPIKGGIFNRVKDHFTAVEGINLSVKPGETLGIVGESGSGKTTLCHGILRLLQSEGKIELDQNRLDQMNQKQVLPFRKKMQIVFQDPYGSLSPRMSIAEIIAEGLEVHEPSLSTSQREERVISILEEVGLDPNIRHRYPHEFSGGQRQRIAIARAMILKPELVVLDEPTSALDRTVQSQVLDLLKDLQEKYKLTYLFISHDLAVVKAISHQLIVLKQGKVVEQGDAPTIFGQPEHQYTKDLMEAAFYEEK